MNNAEYLTAEQVCTLIPGMTPAALAQLRYRGTGPTYLKPTARKILYRESDVRAWVEGTARNWTGEGERAA